MTEVNEKLTGDDFKDSVITPSPIRRYVEVENIMKMNIPTVEYVVPALRIARNSVTLYTGPDGDGKTYFMQAMAVAVARGASFLGMQCRKSRVLYLDYENAAHVMQDRLRTLVSEDEWEIEGIDERLKFWGLWLEQGPPLQGSELLLSIAKEALPLIIIDPFRYFHTAEENDSGQMAQVMQYLKLIASFGCAVIILHHPAKYEGSTGRGSSAIRGACDLALMHTLDRESNQITLRVDKNRFGTSQTLTIRADFEEGQFEVVDAPFIVRRNQDLEKLARIIRENPGTTQNGILKLATMKKSRVASLLKEGIGSHWISEPGPNNSRKYYPPEWVPDFGTHRDPPQLFGEDSGGGSAGPTLKEGPTGPAHPQGPVLVGPAVGTTPRPSGKSLLSCPKCGSTAVYPEPDGSVACQSCDNPWN